MTQILTNQIGYDCGDTKSAVLQAEGPMTLGEFQVIRVSDGAAVCSGSAVEQGTVDRWETGYYYTLRFDQAREPGKYYIQISGNGETFRSFPFDIGENLLELRMISAVGYYFKAQRPTGEFEAAERNLPFRGSKPGVFDLRQGRLDVRGGWYDATGDTGIHLSHLSHTTYFNPQQASFSAYVFFQVNDLLEESGYPYYTLLKRRMLDEGMYGADFLMRMRAPSGTFFRTKDRAEAFLPVNTTRSIGYEFWNPTSRKGGGAYGEMEEIVDRSYEVSLRSGGGYAIAALAAAARHTYPSDFSKEEYLNAAIASFNYLLEHNKEYTNDGNCNLLDDYCALDAAVELYKTTGEYDYLRKAEGFVQKMLGKYVPLDDTMGYLSVDGTKRPFFHAADAGMPVVNLLNFYRVAQEGGLRDQALELAEKLMRHQLSVTNEVSNPFGYARQLIQHGNGTLENQFFYPHDVETAPWWQGENARLASLATAARYLAWHTKDEAFQAELRKFADDQINWVLGLNPYDACMVEGAGRNNNAYFFECRKDFIHCPGGIVNGITGGLHDEHGIDFISAPTEEIKDNWRWAEQWIPHGSWFIYALAMKKI